MENIIQFLTNLILLSTIASTMNNTLYYAKTMGCCKISALLGINKNEIVSVCIL